MFGTSEVSNIWRAMAHWRRSRAIMQAGGLPPGMKEAVAVAVSIVNVCHY